MKYGRIAIWLFLTLFAVSTAWGHCECDTARMVVIEYYSTPEPAFPPDSTRIISYDKNGKRIHSEVVRGYRIRDISHERWQQIDDELDILIEKIIRQMKKIDLEQWGIDKGASDLDDLRGAIHRSNMSKISAKAKEKADKENPIQ